MLLTANNNPISPPLNSLSQDQTDEELVESLLSLVNLPQTTVRTAVRLPVRTRGKSIVLVEMDTEQHEEEVLDHKEELRSGNAPGVRASPLVQIGIRRARDDGGLTVTKDTSQAL